MIAEQKKREALRKPIERSPYLRIEGKQIVQHKSEYSYNKEIEPLGKEDFPGSPENSIKFIANNIRIHRSSQEFDSCAKGLS